MVLNEMNDYFAPSSEVQPFRDSFAAVKLLIPKSGQASTLFPYNVLSTMYKLIFFSFIVSFNYPEKFFLALYKSIS